MRRAKNRFLRIAGTSLGLLLMASVAQALPSWLPGSTVVGSAGPLMSPTTITAMMLETNSASVVEHADGSVEFIDGSMTMTGMWQWDWDSITLDPDPSVDFVSDFTNLDGSAQDFVFSLVVPVDPALASSTYGGSTSVTVGDTGTDGATLSNATSQPGYAGTIDGANELLLLNPLSLSAPPGGTNSKTEWDGLYATISGPAVDENIGIVHKFNLTGLDNATFNSTFNVIPEPGTFALVASGLAGLGLLGRRRQR